MMRETENECNVVRCNKKRMWLNTLLVGICAVALLACTSQQQEALGEVSDQVTETMTVTNTETASNVKPETASATEQIAENVEPTTTESSVQQTVIKETGDLDVEGRMLQIYGKIYHATKEIGPMGDSGSVGGYIESTVAIGEMPEKHGESNFGCVGNPYTFDSGDGSIQVLLEDDNYYWFHTEDKIEWQEAASLVVTKGDTGEQVEVQSSDTFYIEIMEKLDSLHLRDRADEDRVGYAYCIRTKDEEGAILQTITIYGDAIDFDGDLYENASCGDIQGLYLAVDALYPSEKTATISGLVAQEAVVNINNQVKIKASYATANGVNILITNDTGEEISFADTYSLQAKVGEEWKNVEIIKPAKTDVTDYSLGEGYLNWFVLWKDCYGSLPEGTYRVVKGVRCTAEGELRPYTAEFTVPWSE